VPFKPRQATIPGDIVKRFTDLFPEAQEAYRRVNRHLKEGYIDNIASFLLNETKKFSPDEILAQLNDDGTLNDVFIEELKRRRDIAALYTDITRFTRTLT